MGATVRALAETGRVAVDQPVVVAMVGIAGVLAPALAVLAGMLPRGGGLVVALLVHPVLLAGLLHVSTTAAEEPIGISTFLEGIRRHYLGLIGAVILTGIIFLPLGLLAAVIIFGTGVAATVELNVGLGVVLLLVAVMSAGLQFVDASVVVDGVGATGAVERSWAALAHHPVSVLGYTAVRFFSLLGLAVALDVFLQNDRLMTGSIGPEPLWLAAALGLALVGYLSGGLFHAVLYQELSG